MNFQTTTNSTTKHPKGGCLTVKAVSPVAAEFCDTRRFGGRRRSVRGVVVQSGEKGWRVVLNPGENHTVAGHFATATADAAWELAVN